MTPNPEQTETNAPAQATSQSVQPSAQAAPPPPTNSAPTAQPAAAAAQPQPQQAPTATGTYAPYTPYAQYPQQNPSGAYNPYAQYPQYPQYPYQQNQYPGYPQYSYPGYPPYAPPAAPAASGVGAAATSATAKSRRPGLYALIFGVTLAVLLVAVIALAAIAPSFRASETSAIPQGWTRVYDANLTTGDDGHWDESNGCASQSNGLEAGGPTSESVGGICVFGPSATTDLTSQGFLLDVTLAAPDNVPGDQEPTINVGDSTYVVFNQQGTYDVCNTQCDSANPASIYATGSTSAWHEDGFVGNTIGVELGADGSTLTVFVNGVEVVSTSIDSGPSRPPVIAVGAAQGGQAIFTHATLYSGSATSI